MKKNILITGRPRVGKTTLVKHAAVILGEHAGGFYTEEIKGEGVRGRLGFKIVTLDGKEGVLAKVGFESKYNVGLYGVDLKDLEDVGVASIKNALRDKDWVIVDEIGKMEEFSHKFKDTVMEVLNSPKNFLATVREKDSPYTEAIKKRSDVIIIRFTVPLREKIYDEVKSLILK